MEKWSSENLEKHAKRVVSDAELIGKHAEYITAEGMPDPVLNVPEEVQETLKEKGSERIVARINELKNEAKKEGKDVNKVRVVIKNKYPVEGYETDHNEYLGELKVDGDSLKYSNGSMAVFAVASIEWAEDEE